MGETYFFFAFFTFWGTVILPSYHPQARHARCGKRIAPHWVHAMILGKEKALSHAAFRLPPRLELCLRLGKGAIERD